MKTIILLFLIIPIHLLSQNLREGGENGEYWSINKTISIDLSSFKPGSKDVFLWNGFESKLILIAKDYYGNNLNWSIDKNIEPGRYYKIKIVNHDINETYLSNNFFEIYPEFDIEIQDTEKSRINSFPNPVNGLVSILLTSPETSSYTLQVFDLNSVNVMSKLVNVSNGENKITLDVSNLVAGTYNIVISNSHSRYSSIFIKN